jgi:hypothetical protein
LRLKPEAHNRVKKAFVDQELGNEAFTYSLEDGREDSIHVDEVLEYNKDPNYMRDMLLYRLTLEAQKCLRESELSRREIIRRLDTSASQFYRLLDQTNYAKSIDQMLALLNVAGCAVEFTVKHKKKMGTNTTPNRQSPGKATADRLSIGKNMTDFTKTVKAMTVSTSKYYRTPSDQRQNDRSEMLYSLDKFKVNPSFNNTESLKEAFAYVLQLIAQANSQLLSGRDIRVLEPFVRSAATNVQYAFPDKSQSDTVFPDGLWADTILRVSLSNKRQYNVYCLAHEMGHLIHHTKMADENTIVMWEKNGSFPTQCRVDENDDPKDELVAEIVALGVLRTCGIAEYDTLKAILTESTVSGDPVHRIPREMLVKFLNRNQAKNIDWFEKALEAINLYAANRVVDIETFFEEIFQGN